jgi:membrane protein
VDPGTVVRPDIVKLIEEMIHGAQSGSAGVFGLFALIFIVLLLFKSVEDAFNDIWGVRLGRSLLMRVVFYWTILTLGAVLFFGAVTLLSAGAFINVFKSSIENLPGGHELFRALSWSLPLFSVTLLIAMLTLVYRIIPNTRVLWTAAVAGAIVVTALLMLNNFVAFIWLRRVMLTKSLYGSLALPVVLMLGLYIFWLYLLIGGVISYAVQNVHFRNSQAAWSQLNETMRERLSLVVLLTIGRRFQDCLAPVTASQLGDLLKVPTQIVNECLNRLVEMRFITTLRPAAEAAASEHRYQPARPLNKINLYDFKTLDDNLGDDPIGQALERIDPILSHYDTALASIGEKEFFKKNLEELFAEHPFDESRPPFALGERRS